MQEKPPNRIKINYDKFIKAHNGSSRYADMDQKMVELFDSPWKDYPDSIEYHTLTRVINPKTGKDFKNLYDICYDKNKIWIELTDWAKTKSVSEEELRAAFDELKEFFIKLAYAGYTDIKIRKQKKEDNNND